MTHGPGSSFFNLFAGAADGAEFTDEGRDIAKVSGQPLDMVCYKNLA